MRPTEIQPMTSPKRILVVVDPTASDQPAVDRAAWLARQTPSRIELFICDSSTATGDRQGSSVALLAESRKRVLAGHVRRLQAIAAPLLASGLTVDVDARWDSPLYAGIVRKVVDSSADLVLKDTHYVAPLRRSLFSNTDWGLIRECPAMLWLVKPRAFAAKPCVVAAIDPFHEHDKPAKLDAKILAKAEELATASNGELHLFHGVDMAALVAASGDGLSVPAPMPVFDLMEIVRKEHEDAVMQFAREHHIPSSRVHVEQGLVCQLLTAFAEHLRADIVVMGAISRSGLKRLFIGSTAETVLDRLSCDLLLVKPDDMPPDAS